MKKIKIGVRNLAQFLYSSGDLSNEFFYNYDLQEGKKAHLYWQRKYGEKDLSEVYISHTMIKDEIEFEISGFMDGVLLEGDKHIIEEIKSTKQAIEPLDETFHQEYLAQLKLYVGMWLLEKQELPLARLTFINLDSYQSKIIDLEYTEEEALSFFQEAVLKYIDWITLLSDNWEQISLSLKDLRFPFPQIRPGQKKMMQAAFSILRSKELLYVLAPTGIGKTISVLYPALKACQKAEEKYFYLTAKSSLKKIAIDNYSLLVQNGLRARLIELSPKEKMCAAKMKNCNPENCIYSKDFFTKLRDVTKEIIQKEIVITSQVIYQYALEYQMCPFELSLNLSEYVTMIVCDYNYVFDPLVRLIRYFEEGDYTCRLLVDEAHNLIDRSRSMYSSEFKLSDLLSLRRVMSKCKPTIANNVKKIKNVLEELFEEGVNYYISTELSPILMDQLQSINDKCSQALKSPEEKQKVYRNQILDDYLTILKFVKISEYFSEHFRFIVEKMDKDYSIKIMCIDSSKELVDSLKRIDAAVFFSATLTPMDYFQKLISEERAHSITLPSPFKQENLGLYFVNNISTYYKDRAANVGQIIDLIKRMTKVKVGNYIVFFPSYQYLNLVYEQLNQQINDTIYVQKPEMDLQAINGILEAFKDTQEAKLGLFVMGGLFSEGIDFVGEQLSGVMLLGLGLPQINYQNEIIKDYFEQKMGSGFEYAYTYPGFNKVLQAAGRVIRTESDRGVVIIVDTRITKFRYLNLLPEHWSGFRVVKNAEQFEDLLLSFWRKK